VRGFSLSQEAAMTLTDIDKQIIEANARLHALFDEFSASTGDDEILATRIEYAQKRIDELLDERSKAILCA
jgi:hypothetical protein